MNPRKLVLAVALVGITGSASAGGLASMFSSSELRNKLESDRSARLLETTRKRSEEAQASVGMLDELAPSKADFRNLSKSIVARKPAAPPVPPPPPVPGAIEVLATSGDGAQVGIEAGELRRLGPPPPASPPPTPEPPRLYTPGIAAVHVDVPSQRASVRWSFDVLAKEGVMRLALPRSLVGIELDGSPVAVGADGSLPLPAPGAHVLALEYPIEIRRGSQGERAEIWTPDGPVVKLEARLPRPRLSATVLGATHLAVADRDRASVVTAVLPPRRNSVLQWEERVEGLAAPVLPAGSDAAEVSAQSVTKYRIRGEGLEVETRVRWTVGPPGVNRLTLRYPPGLELTDVTDASGRPWAQVAVRGEGEARQILLGLPARQSGELDAVLRLAARPASIRGLRSGGPLQSLALASLAPVDAGRVVDMVAVSPDPRTKVGLGPKGAFQPKDRTELPKWIPDDLTRDVSLLARRMDPGRALELAIEPLRSEPDHYFEVASMEADTWLAPEDRRALTWLELQVVNSNEQFLEVRMPPGARLFAARVKGEPVKPGTPSEDEANPEVVLLALPPAPDLSGGVPPPIPVELVYESPLPRMGFFGSTRLELARPDADTGEVTWRLHHPSGLGITRTGGSFDVPPATWSSRLAKDLGSAYEGNEYGGRAMDKAQLGGYGGRAPMSQMPMPTQMANMANVPLPRPRLSGAERKNLGLMPVTLPRPGTGGSTTLLVRQERTSRGSAGFDLRLRWVDGELVGHLRTAGTLGLVVAVGMLLLRLGGAVSTGTGLAWLGGSLAVGAVLAGLGQEALPVGAALVLGLGLAFLYLLATPIRRLHVPGHGVLVVSLALGALAGPVGAQVRGAGAAGSTGRAAAVLPVPESATPVPLAPHAGNRVLVAQEVLDRLREKAKPETVVPVAESEVSFGDQAITGAVRDGSSQLVLTVPLGLRGPGPWRFQPVAGRLAVKEARIRSGKGAPLRPLTLVPREAATGLVVAHYAALVSGAASGEADPPTIAYQLELDEALAGSRNPELVLDLVVPTRTLPDGGFRLELEPPPGASRSLALELPDDVRVRVEGDPAPRVEESEIMTRLKAIPARSGEVRVEWHPRARHVRPRPEAGRRDPGEAGTATGGAPVPDAGAGVAPGPGTAAGGSGEGAGESEGEPLVTADWGVLYEIGEEHLEGVAELEVEASRGSLDRLTLEVPASVAFTRADGPRVAGPPVRMEEKAGIATWRVPFRSRARGRFSLTLRFRAPMPAGAPAVGSLSVPVPGLRLAEAKDERGRLGISRTGSQEVSSGAAQGLEPAPLEGAEVLAHRFTAAGWKLELTVDRLAPAPVFPATICEATASTRMGKGKVRESKLEMRIRNNGVEFLTLALPEGTAPGSIHLASRQNGVETRIQKIYDQAGRLQIQLPQPDRSRAEPVEVQVSIGYRQEAVPLEGWSGRGRVELPTPDLPMSEKGLAWSLHLGDGLVWSRIDPENGGEPLRPRCTELTVRLPGFLPGGEAARTLGMQFEVLHEDMLLATRVGTAAVAFVAGLGFTLFAGYSGLGTLPRFAGVAVVVVGLLSGVGEGLPVSARGLAIALGLGVILGLFRLRGVGRKVVAAGLLAVLGLGSGGLGSVGTARAGTGDGIDLHYLKPAELEKRVRAGAWASLPWNELRNLVEAAHRPKPEGGKPPGGGEAEEPRIREAVHRLKLRDQAADLETRYAVEGRKDGEWELEIQVGAEAALESVSVAPSGARGAAGGSPGAPMPVLPSGGPGSPDRGHPRPGWFRLPGLSGTKLHDVLVKSTVPLVRRGAGGVVLVSGLVAAAESVEVELPLADAEVEVFPALETAAEVKDGRTRVRATLAPGGTFVVRWASRSVSQAPRDEPRETVEPLRFEADVDSRYRLAGRRVEGTHRIGATVVAGSMERLRIRLPGRLEVLEATGDDVAGLRRGAGDPAWVEVQFRAQRRGRVGLMVRTLELLGPEKEGADRRERELAIPAVEVEGTERLSGYAVLELPAGSAPAELSATGASRLDPREVRPPAPANSLAFRFLAPGWNAKVRLERFPRPAVRELFDVEGSVEVVPLRADAAAYQARYSLRNRGFQSLRVRLPEDGVLISSEVAGRPVKPGRTPEGEYRIPLSSDQGRDGSRFQVTLVYLAPPPDRRVVPPTIVDAPTRSLAVRVHHDPRDRLRVASGPWSEVRNIPEFFEPAYAALRKVPPLLATAFGVGLWIVTLPVSLPLSCLMLTASQQSRSVNRLLGEVGTTLSQVDGGAAPPMPSAAAPGGAFRSGSRELRRDMERSRRQERGPIQQLADQRGMDADDFSGEEAESGFPMDAPVPEPSPEEPASGKAASLARILSADAYKGSLPVPLEFRAQGTTVSEFRTYEVPAGTSPVLGVARLGRFGRRLWMLLIALGAAIGGGLAVCGCERRRAGAAMIGFSLAAAWCLHSLYGVSGLPLWYGGPRFGSGSDPFWFGLVAGTLLGLAWARRPASWRCQAPGSEEAA